MSNEVTYADLERLFNKTLMRAKRGDVLLPCPKEALTAHAFFDLKAEDIDIAEIGFMPETAPFDIFWVVFPYKGLVISAIVEKISDIVGLQIRPDYQFYMEKIDGQRVTTTEAELDNNITLVIDGILRRMLSSHLTEVDSPQRNSINAKLSKSGKPTLSPYIRVTGEVDISERAAKGGTHASPEPHDRKGHWRTYKKSGLTVWINPMKIHGGATKSRNYRVEVEA